MKKFVVVTLFALGIMFSSTQPAHAIIDIGLGFSPAPNAYGDPNFYGWAANALYSAQNGWVEIGNPNTDPAAFRLPTSLTACDLMVTSFHSHNCEAFPAAPFDAALGARTHLVFSLTSAEGAEAEDFLFGNTLFSLLSDDPYNALGFTGDYHGLTFGPTRIGINYGADLMYGTADDTVYTSGNVDSFSVHKVVSTGPGNGFWPGSPSDIEPTADWIYSYLTELKGDISITSQKGNTYSNSLSIPVARPNVVPEPATLSLMGFGLMGAFVRRRKFAS